MPNKQDLIVHLAGTHVNDYDRKRAYVIAGHLVTSALKGQSNNFPLDQKDKIIRDSGDRLWNGYMEKRLDKSITPREAAQEAIFDEQLFLEDLLNQNHEKLV